MVMKMSVGLVGANTLLTSRKIQMFQSNILSVSSGLKPDAPSKQPES
jgi:hypothetical protein